MINQSTIDSLKAMKLTAMAAELEHQLEDAPTYGTLGFEDCLGLLVDAEWNRRQANKLARYIKKPIFLLPTLRLKESNVTKTVNWTGQKSFGLPHANIFRKGTISF